jgi:ribosome-associated protein
MIVVSGTSTRQVTAMAEHLVIKLKSLGMAVRSEGKKQGDWVLVDAGDVVVHLFRPEVRAFYDIERLWASAIARPPAAKAPARPAAKKTGKAAAKAKSMAKSAARRKTARKPA